MRLKASASVTRMGTMRPHSASTSPEKKAKRLAARRAPHNLAGVFGIVPFYQHVLEALQVVLRALGGFVRHQPIEALQAIAFGGLVA